MVVENSDLGNHDPGQPVFIEWRGTSVVAREAEREKFWEALAHFKYEVDGLDLLCEKNPKGLYATLPSTSAVICNLYLKLATVNPRAGDLGDNPPPLLTESQWRTIRLALDGITDIQEHPHIRRESPEDTTSPEDTAVIRWFWGEIIPYSATSLLVAAPKHGKSTLLRGILSHMGGSLLGRKVQRQIAIVVSEEPSAAWGVTTPDIRVRYVDHPPIRSATAWDEYCDILGKLLAAYGSRLLVIDSLSRVCGANESSPTAMTRAFVPLRQLAATGIAVVVVHHAGRSGDVRGSTAIEGQVDQVCSIEPPASLTQADRRLNVVGRLIPRAFAIDYRMDKGGHLVLAGGQRGNGRLRRAGSE